jgi:7-cyano-7-deazaguanine reductase
MNGYTKEHAKAGLNARLPKLETFPNQFRRYEITISYPEFTSICPKTGLPDFGVITIRYMPNKKCLELKSVKMYMIAYRNLGIFYENVVNRMLNDFVSACRPKWMIVKGEFTPRGGMRGMVEAKFPRTPS